MKNIKNIATLFSGGNFDAVVADLAGDIEWHIYENDIHLKGKDAVIEFCKKVAEYFNSVTTRFEQFGLLQQNNNVSIYGHAIFIKEDKVINTVNSCDVYEFDDDLRIKKIYSYCNSKKPVQ